MSCSQGQGYCNQCADRARAGKSGETLVAPGEKTRVDRKSTRLNSSHDQISYAVFCLKKKKKCAGRSEEHTSVLQSRSDVVCRFLLERKKNRSSDTRAVRLHTYLFLTDHILHASTQTC